ncbi:MAG: T9SS type A sorting domain-containing protein [Saprospiraceae bacterium]
MSFLFGCYANFAQPAFPGAEGFGAQASGGRGGKVIYVTNLNMSGPGSFQDALNQPGPRYILFKVSGVIPGTVEVPDGNGDFTIAGQTSPSGIIVRGLEMYNNTNPSVSNIIIRHVRSRIGDTQKFSTPHWLGGDGITIGGVRNGIIDHCSFQHASDEAVDISRSSLLTIQNCILGETLGGHADLGGMLINYSDQASRLDSLSIHHNIWNRIGGRMPEISCETPYCNGKTIHLELSNNLYWDPQIELWYEGITGQNGQFYLQMNAINNLYYGAQHFSNGMYHFDMLLVPQNKLFFSGNQINLYPQYKDYDLFYCCNDFNSNHPNTALGSATKSNQRFDYPSISYTPTDQLQSHIQKNVGAFPRDPMDQRLMNYVANHQIILTPVSEAGADDAFQITPTNSFPEDIDDDGMPDYWELIHGLHTNQQDHNLQQLSSSITGVEGYTNLECYLHCLSEAIINGFTTSECAIQGFSTKNLEPLLVHDIQFYPNPTTGELIIHTEGNQLHSTLEVDLINIHGKVVKQQSLMEVRSKILLHDLPDGLYIFLVRDKISGRMIHYNRIVLVR